MPSDKVIGGLLLIVSIIVIIVYGYLVFLTDYALLLLKLTGFIAVAGVFGILAWIGYTLATTPPPKPIEEIEKEIEEELKKLEAELKEEESKTGEAGGEGKEEAGGEG
ncbi:MAG: transcriptional regulator [Desulfurococcales archaeon]|nr:transcriptional regulator [Desulfurococcales archaeon]